MALSFFIWFFVGNEKKRLSIADGNSYNGYGIALLLEEEMNQIKSGELANPCRGRFHNSLPESSADLLLVLNQKLPWGLKVKE